MEEIRIFHSIKKNALVFLVCFVPFIIIDIITIITLFQGKSLFGSFSISDLMFGLVSVLWGGYGFFYFFMILRERLTGKAYLVITDNLLRINSFKEQVVLFSDVESFIDDGSGIFINYKKGRRPNHNVIRIGNKFIDFGEGFQSRFLTMKTKQLVP